MKDSLQYFIEVFVIKLINDRFKVLLKDFEIDTDSCRIQLCTSNGRLHQPVVPMKIFAGTLVIFNRAAENEVW